MIKERPTINREAKRTKTRKGKFTVVIYNDDTTTMDFVVIVLMTIFDYEMRSAINLMLQIHNSEKKVVGIYPEKLAHGKRNEAMELAKSFGFDTFKVEVEEV